MIRISANSRGENVARALRSGGRCPCDRRFWQTDPIGSGPDLNLYAYVGDDPLDRTDPTGNSPLEIGLGILDVAQAISDIRSGASLGQLALDAGNIALDIAPIPGASEVAHAVEGARAAEKAVQAGGRYASKAEKAGLFERAGGKCEYCGKDITREAGKPNSMHADHIKAHAKGGETKSPNLAASCPPCNLSKGTKDVSSQAGPGKFVPPNPNERIKGIMKD